MPELPPEIPYPFRPWQEPPQRTTPISIPVVDLPSAAPRDHLFDRRTVLLSGRLDGVAATDLCAELMMLDGRSAADVDVIVNSEGGPVADVAAILDVFELMRADVNATCIGMAQGTAAVVLACASGERRAGRNARISLRIEPLQVGVATAAELQRCADERAAQLAALAGRLEQVTGQTVDTLTRELDAGTAWSAAEAQARGLIDRVVERG
jgi:ATP-dependent Clp protease protease subunit